MPAPAPKKTLVVEGCVDKVVLHGEDPSHPRYGLEIDGKWYNDFGSPTCAQGDTVSVSFEKVTKGDQEYRNIKTCTVLEPAETKASQGPVSVPDRVECINRAVALKAAVELASACAQTTPLTVNAVEAILIIADKFERWLNCETTESVLK